MFKSLELLLRGSEPEKEPLYVFIEPSSYSEKQTDKTHIFKVTAENAKAEEDISWDNIENEALCKYRPGQDPQGSFKCFTKEKGRTQAAEGQNAGEDVCANCVRSLHPDDTVSK